MPYKKQTDKYFLYAKDILENRHINPIVKYQVFTRRDVIVPRLNGVINFIRRHAKSKIEYLEPFTRCPANTPIIKITDNVQNIIDLETCYLGMLSGLFNDNLNLGTMKTNIENIKAAAEDKDLYYFGARHFDPDLNKYISNLCSKNGFKGCSTDEGAAAGKYFGWITEGVGTIPHALILAYKAHMIENDLRLNPTVEIANKFDHCIKRSVPRIILIDTFNKESDDTLAVCRSLKNVDGVRIDTCGENYAQCCPKEDIEELKDISAYKNTTGVSLNAVWGLRRLLDENGFQKVGITVSSGFNADKISVFMKADKIYRDKYSNELFNAIGTGSVADNMINFTSDIVSYYSVKESKFVPLSKAGRAEQEFNVEGNIK